MTFGTGADMLTIGDTARFDGVADFAGGAGPAGDHRQGHLRRAARQRIARRGDGRQWRRTFAANGVTNIASLSLGDQFDLERRARQTGEPDRNLIQVGGANDDRANSQLALRVSGGTDVTGRYVVLRSGT